MQISLDKLIRNETDKLELNLSESIDFINHADKSYKLVSPINLNGKISSTKNGLYLDVEVDFTILDECSRCLDEVRVPIKYTINGFLVKEDYDEDSFEEDDAFIYDGQSISIVDLVEQTLDFRIPSRVLCDEDCMGLCLGCGANLNKEECSCNEDANDEEIIDPRFAKLKDIFKND